MIKVMTLIGTRPEIIKMSRVICELDKCFDHILVHSGQNYDYELNQVFFDDLEIRKPDIFLNICKDSLAQSIADIIAKSDKVFEQHKPDAFMIYGDTNTCLAVIAAKRRKIPIFHMEAGNRCFDQRVPEELNRKIVDHLSDINLVLTEHARRYLILEGIKPETIIKTGSHMYEVIDYYKSKILSSSILEKLSFKEKQYFVVSLHREENVDDVDNLKILIESLEKLASDYNLPIFFSTHPRTRKRIKNLYKDNEINYLIKFENPVGLFDYLCLQKNALCVLSDSGTLTEEASLLNLPAVMLRQTHERPEGMDYGTVIMSGLSKELILKSVKLVIDHHNSNENMISVIEDYKAPYVSKQIVRLLTGYIEYVNRNVWRKFEY